LPKEEEKAMSRKMLCYTILMVLVVGLTVITSGVFAKETTLTVWGIVTAPEQAWDKLYAKFEQEHPEVKVKNYGFMSETFMEMFMAAHAGGEQIDVLFLNGQDARYFATAGILMDLSGKVDYIENRLIPFAKDVYKFAGRQYAVSVGGVSTSGFYYNKKYFRDVGASEPVSYEELAVIGKKIKAKGIAPLTHMGKIIYMWPMWIFETYGQTSGNDSVRKTALTLKNEIKFTHPEYIEAIDAIGRFARDGLFISGVNALDREASLAIFMAGKAAMHYGGTWEIPGFRMNGPKEFNDNVWAFIFPKLKPQFSPQPCGGAGIAAGVYSKIDPSRKELALEFIEYVSRDENVKFLAEIERYVHTTNVNVAGSSDPLAIYMGQKMLPNTKVFLDWIWPPEVNRAFQQGIQAVVGGQMIARQAMEFVQEEFDKLVTRGYKFVE